MSTAEQVVRLAARGDGVTEAGRYIAGAVPGDTVMGDVVTPGPHRVVPACEHFGVCGGCQLQHTDEETLRAFVSGRITGALAGVGIVPEQTHPTYLSPSHSRRRASLRAIRDADGFRFGFNASSSNDVIDLKACHVVTPELWSIISALRDVLPGLLAKGRTITVTITQTLSGFDIVLGGSVDLSVNQIETLSAFSRANKIARITLDTDAGQETAIQNASPTIRLGGVAVGLPPGGFLQPTRDGEVALQAAVLNICKGAGRVADLFCGVGTFALPLAEYASVVAADAAKAAVTSLDVAAKAANRAINVLHRDLFRAPLEAQALSKFDAIVLDPPRAGAKAQVAELAKSRVKKIAYVSCNPNTFARDAEALSQAGFALHELWPVGQFRWSTHVELVAAFYR